MFAAGVVYIFKWSLHREKGPTLLTLSLIAYTYLLLSLSLGVVYIFKWSGTAYVEETVLYNPFVIAWGSTTNSFGKGVAFDDAGSVLVAVDSKRTVGTSAGEVCVLTCICCIHITFVILKILYMFVRHGSAPRPEKVCVVYICTCTYILP
jgi:hypothetical protein